MTAVSGGTVLAAGACGLTVAFLDVAVVPLLPNAERPAVGLLALTLSLVCLLVVCRSARRSTAASGTTRATSIEAVAGPCDGQRVQPLAGLPRASVVWLAADGDPPGPPGNRYTLDTIRRSAIRYRYAPLPRACADD